MSNAKFETAKIKRLINSQGKYYTFFRVEKNDYGEKASHKEIACIKGVYHEKTTHVKVKSSEAALVPDKNSSSTAYFILAKLEDTTELEQGDYLCISKSRYSVNEVIDFMNWGIFGEISLEVVT